MTSLFSLDEFLLLYRDPVSYEPLKKAVRPECSHLLNEETAAELFGEIDAQTRRVKHPGPCPICRERITVCPVDLPMRNLIAGIEGLALPILKKHAAEEKKEEQTIPYPVEREGFESNLNSLPKEYGGWDYKGEDFAILHLFGGKIVEGKVDRSHEGHFIPWIKIKALANGTLTLSIGSYDHSRQLLHYFLKICGFDDVAEFEERRHDAYATSNKYDRKKLFQILTENNDFFLHEGRLSFIQKIIESDDWRTLEFGQ